MKILVFSDSHGRGKNIIKAIEDHGGVCDAVIFLGDTYVLKIFEKFLKNCLFFTKYVL